VIPLTRLFTLAALGLLAVGLGASAQSPSWRSDYGSARREATDKQRPILLDFGTENCFWCKRLDATTFRDPNIANLINEQFIPLKIDAEREAVLAQKLQIQSYPTLVLAAPDGKILTVIEGFVEPAKLLPHLNAAVAACVPTPEWMVKDFQAASKAIGLGDNARAIALLKTIADDGKERSVQQKARQHLKTLEQQADNRLAHARSAEDNGQMLEAIDTLTELMRVYPGTPAADEAKGLLTSLAAKPEVRQLQRQRRAAELFAQARRDFRTEQFFNCLEKCETLTASYSETTEATEAAKMADEIKANPLWMARACNNLNDRLSTMYLALAESWLKKGKLDEAAVCLEKVQQLSPGSPHAQMAQIKLGQLQGKSSQRTDFKKP
jgi:thioredoxin-like negative regulator of GroEL